MSEGRTLEENVAQAPLENPVILASIEEIYNAMCNTAAKELGITPTVTFIQLPNEFAWSTYKNGHFKSDGTGWRKESFDPRPSDLKRYPFLPE